VQIEWDLISARSTLVVGGTVLGVAVVLLALGGNWRRVLVGIVGGIAGYVFLGGALARKAAEGAMAKGQCPDVGWVALLVGEGSGVLLAVVLFQIAHSFRHALGSRQGPPSREAAG
jgi:hypothetical protein